jgi:hypothetical protein
MDLNAASEIAVEALEDATVVTCTVVSRQEGREVGRSNTSLYIEGVSKPGSPGDWTTKMKAGIEIPDSPISGTLLGGDFTAKTAELTPNGMSFRNGQDRIDLIFLNFKPGKDVYDFGAEDQPGKARPHLHISLVNSQPSRSTAMAQGYIMRLEFGKEKDGKVSGKLYLCLPEDKGCISGTFTMDVP